MSVEESVGDGFAAFKCYEGTLFSVLDFSFVRAVFIKNGINNTASLGVREKFIGVSDKSS